MAGLQCAFCKHANPEQAKFCNACGSPLNLRPCTECDAVNEHAARACYKCGGPICNVEPATAVSSACVGQSARAVDADVEHESLARPSADIFALFAGSSALGPDHRERHPSAVLHRAHRDWRELVFGALGNRSPSKSVALSASGALPGGLATSLRASLTGIVVVILTVSVYYAYRHPIGMATWLHAPRSGPTQRVSGDPQPGTDEGKTFVSGNASIPRSEPAISSAVQPPEAERAAVGNIRSVQGGSSPETPAETGTIDRTDAPTAASVTTADASVAPMTTDASAPMQAPSAPMQAASGPANIVAATIEPETSSAQSQTRDGRPRQGMRRASTIRLPRVTANAAVPAPLREVESRRSAQANPSIPPCTDAIAALGLCNRAATEDSR